MRKIVTLVTVLLFIPMALCAETLYVRSKTAKIKSAPSFSSEDTGVVKKGTELAVIEKKGSWYNVTAGEVSGWVSRLNIAHTPPLEKATAISENSASIEGKSRVRASAITSAAAARGLTDEERKRRSSSEKADYKSLKKVEDISNAISEKEVEEFSDFKK